jgi:hypothetical protein
VEQNLATDFLIEAARFRRAFFGAAKKLCSKISLRPLERWIGRPTSFFAAGSRGIRALSREARVEGHRTGVRLLVTMLLIGGYGNADNGPGAAVALYDWLR